jgi:hypothetical protein
MILLFGAGLNGQSLNYPALAKPPALSYAFLPSFLKGFNVEVGGWPLTFYVDSNSNENKQYPEPAEIGTRTKVLAPTISCPANFTSPCLPAATTTYTHNSNSLDATFTLDGGCNLTSLTYTSSGAGVAPANGNTLNGAVFNVGTTTITWRLIDDCGNDITCSFTVTVRNNPTITASPSLDEEQHIKPCGN